MILTGKAKENFLIKIYYSEDTNQDSDESKVDKVIFHALRWIERQDERLVYSLIIDWFDSVDLWEDLFYKEYRATGFKDYKQAVVNTIEKGDKLYNEKWQNDENNKRRKTDKL